MSKPRTKTYAEYLRQYNEGVDPPPLPFDASKLTADEGIFALFLLGLYALTKLP